ncbi:MAG: Phenylacetate-CoA ligase [Berkelbacteria bacterium GW2011_GWA2_38_9]|uniref:Phenylacetate-CoA ligase n=1 Tax=Berkelbacteria bacterium GW2011_GWA2_38_9 TaxID=1618334 RepID=A0A0G0PEM0_9BACT|nr:MAG: Phenylacetate-CoA ligase [Berkelbacteria bacterium GW2011_GWA2_38_9]
MKIITKQLCFLNETFRVARNSELYKLKLRKCPTKLDDIAELENIPFTTKKELRDCYPFGSLAVPIKDVVELHTSSGTTGKATLSYLTRGDLKVGSQAISESWKCFGINNKSRVQFMMSYGLFSGAPLNTYAIQELGALVVPAGIQPAEKQIQMLIDFKIDTVVATPGYYFYLFDYLKEKGISLQKLSLKRGIAAGEIYSDAVRKKIEDNFKFEIFDHYGLCEVNTGIAYECKFKNGLHVLDEYVLPEIINPKNCQVLPSNTDGELVLTTLNKKASPLIRYRTGDVTALKSGKCLCGRNSVRIERIKRRVDDLIFIKGIKIDPHELKEHIFEVANDRIYNDIKIIIRNGYSKHGPEILLTLKNVSDINLLSTVQKSLKDKTLLTFDIKHVERDYFRRGQNNKVKFIEHVD